MKRSGSKGALSRSCNKVTASRPDTTGAINTPVRNFASAFGRSSSATIDTPGANTNATNTSRMSAAEKEKDTRRLSPTRRLAARLPSKPPASTQHHRLGSAAISCPSRTALVNQIGAISPAMVLGVPLARHVTVVTTSVRTSVRMPRAKRDDSDLSENALNSGVGLSPGCPIFSLNLFVVPGNASC